MPSSKKKTPPRSSSDDQLVAYTLNVPTRWLAEFDEMAKKEPGEQRSHVARRARAIGLDALKKRAR